MATAEALSPVKAEPNPSYGLELQTIPLSAPTITDPEKFIHLLDSCLETQRIANRLTILQQNLQSTERLIFPANIFGLGDNLIALPYIAHLAKAYPNKQVTALTLPHLTSFLSRLDIYPPNLDFQSNITTDELTGLNTKTILLHEFIKNKAYDSPQSWISNVHQLPQPDSVFFSDLQSQHRLLTPSGLLESGYAHQICRLVIHPNPDVITHHEEMQLILLSLGVTLPDFTYHQPFFTPPPSQQHLATDILIMPDASEGNGQKLFTPNTWQQILVKLANNARIGVVIGTANPQYCQNIFKLAQQFCLDTIPIQGDLYHLSSAIASTKTVVGMDSGTSHLAELIWANLPTIFPKPNIKTFFNRSFTYCPIYALRCAPVMTYKSAKGLADFNPTQIQLATAYIQDN